jgi:hypothetical protein
MINEPIKGRALPSINKEMNTPDIPHSLIRDNIDSVILLTPLYNVIIV